MIERPIDRPINERVECPVLIGVVLNELNAEISEGTSELTLSDLVQWGVDRDACLKLPAHVIQFTDGRQIEFRSDLGWWLPV